MSNYGLQCIHPEWVVDSIINFKWVIVRFIVLLVTIMFKRIVKTYDKWKAYHERMYFEIVCG